MEERSESTRYWCHECSRAVETFMDSDIIKCSFCHGGFVEEMDSARSDHHTHNHHHHHHTGDSLSLLAPILLGMMSSNPRPRRRSRQIESDESEDNNDPERGESELETIMRRRRRNPATILQLLQGLRPGRITDSNSDNNNGDRERGENNNRERDRERVIIINPSNQTIIVQGGGSVGGGNPFDSGGLQPNHPIGSLGDYFLGPGLELLLQHLAENDTNRYGTPPAQKEAVEAMPTLKIEEDSVQCSVCLEDFGVGNEAKEMPCRHKFHGDCIFAWLELHSSCPVCRYQLPSDDSKLERERDSSRGLMVNTNRLTGPENGNGEVVADGDTEGRNTSRLSIALARPFNSLFSYTPGAQIESPHLIMDPSTQSGSGSGSGPPVNESSEDEGGQWEDDH